MPQLTIQQALTLAMQHQQGGNFSEAERIYRQILLAQPNHPDALHLLGTVALESRRLDEARELIGRAIQAYPAAAHYHCNLGHALAGLGKTDEAMAAFRQSLALDADSPDTHNGLGNAFQAQRQFDEAIKCYRQALQFRPQFPEAMNNLGNALADSDQREEALNVLSQAVALRPEYAEAHNNLGRVLLHLKRFDEALASLQKALSLRPEFPEALDNLGSVLQEVPGRTEDAIAAHRRAIALRPDFVTAYNNLAVAFRKKEDHHQAIAILRQAIALRPDHADALNNLAHSLHSLREYDEALATARRAVAVRPDFAEAQSNLGACLESTGDTQAAVAAFRQALSLSPGLADAYHNLAHSLNSIGQYDEALDCARKAVEIRPDFADAKNNLGTCLRNLGDISGALATYRDALKLAPEDALIHVNLGLTLLLTGDFENGWAEHEWRTRSDEVGIPPPPYPAPIWDGSDLRGRRILLFSEQGYGDAIQFSRYVTKMRELGASRTMLAVPRELLRLMKTLDGVDDLIIYGEPPPEFGVQCSLLSLPAMLKTNLATIPANVPYLRADPELSSRWRQRLPGDKKKIGLVWAGRSTHKNDLNRSMPMSALAPLAEIPGATFISLQKGISPRFPAPGTPGERQGEGILPLLDWTSELTDFADTASLIDNLDLVITVDTSVAHLAGAMGKPVWILLPFVPDWRWLLDRPDSPWYPTAGLFHQPRIGDWQTPVRQVLEALKSL